MRKGTGPSGIEEGCQYYRYEGSTHLIACSGMVVTTVSALYSALSIQNEYHDHKQTTRYYFQYVLIDCKEDRLVTLK